MIDAENFSGHGAFYLQPFKWEEDAERRFDDKSQVIHCWAMAIPAAADGTPLSEETTTTCLFRVKNYPSRVTLIVPSECVVSGGKVVKVTEKELREIRTHFESWVTSYHGMTCLDREGYHQMKHSKEGLVEYFTDNYREEYTPKRISWERRRKVYYYKRTSDTELPADSPNRYPEQEDWVMHLDFVNTRAAQKFVGTFPGGYMSGEYIDRARCKAYVKQIMGKTYRFDVGFKGIDSVQKLLSERKVPRCGWFFVRDAEAVKPAERVTAVGVTKSWVTEKGETIKIFNGTPEFFIDSVSILAADPGVARRLKAIPSTVSWDIECYSDNHKALPVAWNPKHAAYIITAVYQQYKRPETRIRKAFVYGRCDYDTPTEEDGKTSCLVRCETEMEMIDGFSQFVQDVSPEILIGYNIFGFDINYLNIRMERCLRSWNNMGRLKENITVTKFRDMTSNAYGKNEMYWIEAPGRICVDMMKIIERDYKFPDYKLETVSQSLLGKGKNDVTPQEMFAIYELCLNGAPGCEREMFKVVLYGIQDAVLPIELFEKINGWPFFIESSNVMCVNPMDLFTRGQQMRLLNQFYDKCFYMGFVIDGRKVNIIEAEGAYVVPPKRGLHENIMTLDFASLYPSIMIAHNVGHDTLVLDESIPDEHCHVFSWKDEDEEKLKAEGGFEADVLDVFEQWADDKAEKEEVETAGQKYEIKKNENGEGRFRFIKAEYGHRSIAATMLVDLLAARKAVRTEQKKVKDTDPVYWGILEQRQLAIKVSCNSVYGMLLAQATGKLALAEGGVCVTYRGRQLNLEMQRLARERYGAETIYGDSVTGDTPVLVRDPIHGMRYENIEDLGLDWQDGYHGTKEFSQVVDGLEVWSDQGFTKVENLIRHKCNKKLFRVVTDCGCVDVTEDHSLLNERSEKVSPKDVVVGTRLLHHPLPAHAVQQVRSGGAKRNVAEYFWTMFEQTGDLYRIDYEYSTDTFCMSKTETLDGRVREIIDLGYTENYVYDFTTANHHFAAGIGRLVVHNTDSIMVKTAYTRLMVETAKRFSDTRPSIEEINRLAGELGLTDYSTEVAGRFLEHYHGFKEEYEVCNEMGEHIARDISSHLPKPISLEFENVFVVALFLMKKRYACLVLDRANMVVKRHPKKMYTKGIMLARRDNCPWARELFRDALFNILDGKTRQEVALIVNEHIQRLLSWQVPLKELEIIQKLGFDYKSETFPLKLFSEHLQDIGKPAKPNDRLAFIVSRTANRLVEPAAAKLGHYYRLSETLREEISRGENAVDYLYYIERLKNDVDQIFSIGFMTDIERDNNQRKLKERSVLNEKLSQLETRIKELQERCEHYRTHPGFTKKEQIEIRKKLVLDSRLLKDVNKEHEKVTKKNQMLEAKGMEVYNKKNQKRGLFLDDTFFEHVLEHLTLRKNVLEEVKAGKVLKPVAKKTSPSAKKRIEDYFGKQA